MDRFTVRDGGGTVHWGFWSGSAGPGPSPARGRWSLMSGHHGQRMIFWPPAAVSVDPPTPTPGPGGGEDEPPRRPRFVVRNGDELLVFRSERDALSAQRAVDDWEAAHPPEPKKKATPKPAEELPAQPLQTIPLPDLRSLAVGYGMQAAYDQAMHLKDLERAVALWQRFQAEEQEAERLLVEDTDALTARAEDLLKQYQAFLRRRKPS